MVRFIVKLNDEELKREQIQKFSSFARDSVRVNIENKSSRGSRVNKTQILRYLDKPYNYVKELQAISVLLDGKNGIYSRLINYMMGLLTYDYFIYNTGDLPKGKKNALKQFEDCARYIGKLKIKNHCPTIARQMLLLGEVFLYEIEDKNTIIYKEIPNEICRIIEIEDNVCRYEVDFSKISSDDIINYPTEFQNLYKKEPSNNPESNSKGSTNWQRIGNKGVAFTLNRSRQKSIPLFSYLFPDIVDLEEVKKTQVSDSKDDNVKIVHGKVPIDNASGLPTMDVEVVRIFNEAVKNALPSGYASIVNPFDTNVINLKDNGKTDKLSKTIKDSIYENSGVSDMLFANDKASSEALKRSIETDIQMMYALLLPQFDFYYNYKLNKKYSGWEIELIRTSHFTKKDDFKDAMTLLQLGGSRLYVFALKGIEPLQALNLMKLEQTVIKIDDIMKPPQSSYTQSGKDNKSSEEKGRPSITEGEHDGEITDSAESNIQYK